MQLWPLIFLPILLRLFREIITSNLPKVAGQLKLRMTDIYLQRLLEPRKDQFMHMYCQNIFYALRDW